MFGQGATQLEREHESDVTRRRSGHRTAGDRDFSGLLRVDGGRATLRRR